MTYRNDLDAALARNHALAQRVHDLEHALGQHPTREPTVIRSTPPALASRPRPPAKQHVSRIVYAAPATYVPCLRQYARYVSRSGRKLWSTLPSLDVPVPPSSNIVVLEALRRLLLVVWFPLFLALQIVWFMLVALWFAICVPLVGVATLAVTPIAAQIVVLASVRIRRPGAPPPAGVAWGARPTDESANVYAVASLAAVMAAVPIVARMWVT